jgi:hypothetical protein
MKRKTTLGVFLAIAATAPAVVAPKLVAPAQAQAADRAEYPDVPRGHWAYEALNRLSQAGIIEGLPNGNYGGNKSMTRYEFAVAIARLLDKIGDRSSTVQPTTTNPPFDPTTINNRLTALEARPVPDITRAEVNDLIGALRREFADELARLGVRVDALEGRVSNLENRVAAPPRVTITPSLLHRTGTATYIGNSAIPGAGPFTGSGPGRSIVNGNSFSQGFGPGTGLPIPPYFNSPNRGERFAQMKYGYTDFELRLTDRVTDRLSVTGALRSIGSTQEDEWAGDIGGFGSTAYLREGFAVADLSDRSFLGIRGLTAILGRQRTKIGQGLLYDNDLQPTDQIHGQFNLGPIQINGFVGSTNNQTLTSTNGGAYTGSGAVRFLGLNGAGNAFFPIGSPANNSGAAVGFPQAPGVGGTPGNVFADDNEAGVRAGINLFRIAGQPVGLGVTRVFDAVQNQKGDSVDLTIPLFNRTIGVEYVRERQYFNGQDTVGDPKAYNVTVPLFRARILDLNFAYGKADNDFEYFAASSANPFARTYGEALFDRPMALGAPMINGRGSGTPGQPLYAAAKEAFDFNGTLRILRRLPLDFRFYRAYGSQLQPGGRINALDLGDVYTVGTTFNVSPGLDLELKYGNYNVKGPYPSIQYVRVGANVGF